MKALKYPNLFSPLQIGDTVLKNRIITAPMSVPSARTKVISSTDYGGLSVVDKSLGGAAVITIGEHAIEKLADEPTPFEKYARDVSREILSVAHQSGSLACMEFKWHSAPDANGKRDMPSDGEDPFHSMGVAMTRENMRARIDDLCSKAAAAKDFGFDLAMVHMAHDSLTSLFLSPVWNKRTDEYGGSLENRMRFSLEALEALRKAVGPDFPIIVRVSRQLMLPESFTEDDMMAFIKAAAHYVDVFNISCGGDCYGGYTVEDYLVNTYAHVQQFEPRFFNLDFCARVKEELGGQALVAIVGGVSDPARCEEYIAGGKFDLVVMGRQLNADPFWPKKALEGRDEDIVPCLRCTNCYHISTIHNNVQCAVNPRFRRENRVPLKLEKTDKFHKVVVVGGGPAGMKAALTADEKGHHVILLEKEKDLGGQLRHAVYDHYKEDLSKYVNYLKCQLAKSDVEIRLGVEATPEYVAQLEPDDLIVAVGADFTVPHIPGIENTRLAVSIYPELDTFKGKVVVVGGGTVGAEIGLELAENGNDVTIVEMRDVLAASGNWLYRHALREHVGRCESLHVELGATVQEIRKDSVVYVNDAGETVECPADLILNATGLKSRRALANTFFGITPRTTIVGDCRKVGTVVEATNDSYFIAANI